jgi:hypothetical protein
MALPDTFTLTVGATPTARVFDVASRSNGTTSYYADSPNGDLAGRYSIRVSNEETSGGLVRTLIQVKLPYQVSGEYGQHVQANVVLTRPNEAALATVDEVLEMVQEIWAVTDFRTEIGEAAN